GGGRLGRGGGGRDDSAIVRRGEPRARRKSSRPPTRWGPVGTRNRCPVRGVKPSACDRCMRVETPGTPWRGHTADDPLHRSGRRAAGAPLGPRPPPPPAAGAGRAAAPPGERPRRPPPSCEPTPTRFAPPPPPRGAHTPTPP